MISKESNPEIEYVYADEAMKAKLVALWGNIVERHMHIEDGFSIVPTHVGDPIGLISVYWRQLPPPLPPTNEGYIDIIEVIEGYRRRGIATELIRLSAERASKEGAYQLRAWSSEDKNGYFVTKSL